MAALLKIQNGRHRGVGSNGKIVFWTLLGSSNHNDSNEVLQVYIHLKSLWYIIFFNLKMAAILKIQDGRHRGVGSTGKIIFLTQQVFSSHNEYKEVLQVYIHLNSLGYITLFHSKMAAILKIQDGHQKGFGSNGNIGFWIQQGLTFPKMYSFQTLQE